MAQKLPAAAVKTPPKASKNRHDLPAGKSRHHRRLQHIKIANQGVGLFLGIVLLHRNEINIFSRHQKPDIFQIGGKRVVRRKRDHYGAVTAKLCLDRHRHGAISNPRRKLGERITRTRRDNEHIERDLGANRLRRHDRVNDGRAAYSLHRTNGIHRLSETGIGGIYAIVHNGEQGVALRRKITQNTHGFGNRAKRTAKTISYHV